jgi:hypothetical protein
VTLPPPFHRSLPPAFPPTTTPVPPPATNPVFHPPYTPSGGSAPATPSGIWCAQPHPIGPPRIQMNHMVLWSRKMRQRLQLLTRSLAWNWGVEPVPSRSSLGVSGLEAERHREPIRVPFLEQVPKDVGRMEPLLKQKSRSAGPRLTPQPGPLAQAKALLCWLQQSYPPGTVLKAWELESELYPRFAEEKGLSVRPWGSRNGVGKYLREVPGVEKISPYLDAGYGYKERVRCYRLPLADAATVAVRLPALRRAA